VIAISPAHWRADCWLATSYNICPVVACAYRGVFIEPLPSNDLSKSDTIYGHVFNVFSDYRRVWIGNRMYWTLALVTTNNYDSLTELHTPKITVTETHIKSSQCLLAVVW
jgi:hypothetical protein